MNSYYTLVKKLIYVMLMLTLSVLISSTAFSQTWTKIEGTGFYINDLYLPQDNPSQLILAITALPTDLLQNPVELFGFGSLNDGYVVSNDSGKTFSGRVIPTYNVFKVLKDPENPNIWYASVRYEGTGGIVVSTDNGNTWDTTTLRCSGSDQIVELTGVTGEETIYAGAINSSRGIRMTTDTFRTCITPNNLDISTRSIEISPLDRNLMFAAGDAQYTQGVLRSYDNGKTWLKDVSGLERLRILCVMPSAHDKAVVFCGADSLDNVQGSHGKGIYISQDTGVTWSLVGAPGARVMDISRHPLNPRYYAAACEDQGVFFSGSYGYAWEQANTGLPDTASIRKVAIPAWVSDTGTYAYAYAYGDGLYRSNKVITSVDESYYNESGIGIVNVYPQPFKSSLAVTFNNPAVQMISISIKDVFGREVYSLGSKQYDSGINTFTWVPDGNISPGVYYLLISVGRSTVTEKVMYIR